MSESSNMGKLTEAQLSRFAHMGFIYNRWSTCYATPIHREYTKLCSSLGIIPTDGLGLKKDSPVELAIELKGTVDPEFTIPSNYWIDSPLNIKPVVNVHDTPLILNSIRVGGESHYAELNLGSTGEWTLGAPDGFPFALGANLVRRSFGLPFVKSEGEFFP